jgi:RNA polymerase sigma-70 factor (ECF subfamily)
MCSARFRWSSAEVPRLASAKKPLLRNLTGSMEDAELRTELEKHHREAFGWALSCCFRHPADAETVLQTAYLKILEGKARFGGDSSFRTWLFAVIRNTASDLRRREWLRYLRLTGNSQSAGTHRLRSFEDDVYESEVRALFLRALGELPRRQREALQLVFYHDLSLTEAAAVMNISIGSARTHYERGKKQLRRLMADSGVFDERRIGRAENQTAIP